MKHPNQHYATALAELSAQSKNRVQRVSVPSKLLGSAKKHVIDKVSADLQDQLAKVRAANKLSNLIMAPSVESLKHDPDAKEKFTELNRARAAARPIQHKVGRNVVDVTTFVNRFATLGPGAAVLSPPWDVHWNVPNDSTQYVNGTTDANDFMAVICNGSNDTASGFGAAGFGVFLTSPVQRLVSIRPYMPNSFGYSFWATGYSSNSRGGFGFLVYDGSGSPVQPTPLQSESWDRTANYDGFTHIDGTDFLQAHLPPPDYAFDFTMNPGETYQLWCWIWGHADQSGIVFDTPWAEYGSYADFVLTANLPFIVVF